MERKQRERRVEQLEPASRPAAEPALMPETQAMNQLERLQRTLGNRTVARLLAPGQGHPSAGGPIQRTLQHAIIYCAHNGLNHALPATVEVFIAILKELAKQKDGRYEGLKQHLYAGMASQDIAAIEGQLNGAKEGTPFGEMVFESEDDSEDEDFASDYSVPKTRKRTTKPMPGQVVTSNMMKPTSKKKASQGAPSAKMQERNTLATKGGFLQRPPGYGPVTITNETINHVSGQDIQRPVSVSGLVYPTTTSGRPGAPEPGSGIKVGVKWKEVGSQTTRNTGIVDAQKGHIMALELGGPDMSANIVPQWANWQANGAWRQMEKQVLAQAEVLKKKGHFLQFDATILYKSYAVEEQGTLRGLTFPTGFHVQITELNVNKQKVADGTIAFNGEQAQDETDFTVSGKIFDRVDNTPVSKMELEERD